MIDIHAHILPQVDDGPNDWQDTIALLKQGIADGIQGVVCTSHVLNQLDDRLEGSFLLKFDQLKEQIQKHDLKIDVWLGSEIHSHSDFRRESKVATINGYGKYMLIEFPMSNVPADAGKLFFDLSITGTTPILAHPERNAGLLKNPEQLFELVQRGILMQMNASSLTGRFGKEVKRFAYTMMEQDWVHFVASDCHSIESRPMILSEAYNLVAKEWGREKAEACFVKNPMAAVNGEPVETPHPKELKKKKRGLFSFGS